MIPRINRAATLCFSLSARSTPAFKQSLLFGFLLLTAMPLWAQDPTTSEPSLFQQRALYLQALDHLRDGATSKFRAKAKRLEHYPLRPYLDYHRINGRLNHVSAKEMNEFMSQYGDLAPSDILYRRWLKS